MNNNSPLVSIITVCYNSKKTIRKTFDSLMLQTYTNIEYIIVDGFSKDGTVELVREFIPLFEKRGIKVHLISEPDLGIYDAMNKGVRIASGKLIGLLNSDDELFSKDTISSLVNEFNKSGAKDGIYSDIIMVNAKGRTIRYWKAKYGSITKGWIPPHPGIYFTKEKYEQMGLYNIKYKIAADSDLIFRAFSTSSVSFAYLSQVTVKMRLGGASTGSIKGIFNGVNEVYQTLRSNNFRYPLLTLFLLNFRKLKSLRFFSSNE